MTLDLTDPRQDRDVPSGTAVGVGGEAATPAATNLLPLRDRAGEIVAHALVDADVYPALAARSWCIDQNGYVVRVERVNGKQVKYRLHRVVMCCSVGDELHIDHINRNKLDNRRANLRYVTPIENAANRGRRNRDGRPPAAYERCRNGHTYQPDNYQMSPRGTVICLTCLEGQRARKRKPREQVPA